MNNLHVSTGGATIGSSFTMTNSINSGMMSDDMSEPSSPESSFDASDILNSSSINDNDVTAQLAHSGTIGMAAAAAIASGKKHKRPHAFETNPSIRKRQQTRLLRKLKACIEEYTTRVGQQAVVLCCTPGKSQNSNSYKVFGSQPLESVIRNCKSVVLQDLESTLAEQVPQSQDVSGMQELPPLSIDGIPTSVDKMTQAQLRTFIPEMLKFSTGRSKPGWGKAECRPMWWPMDVPWANVRSDVRTTEQKKKVSWTEALRTIVNNCYRHHGREDLLHVFENAEQKTMLQTINNPDGTISVIQIDTTPNQVVTLQDGTQATVVHTVTQDGPQQQEATHAVQTLADVAVNHQEVVTMSGMHMTPVSVEINSDTIGHRIAHINEDGHIILSGDDLGGSQGIVIPVSYTLPHSAVVSVTAFDALQTQSGLQVAMAPMTIAKQETSEDIQEEITETSCDMSMEDSDDKLE
ncbi:nuclear respiratory factor 1-like isoform X2 [Crassostrea virginica]|uniref:DNA-binding protein P3A2-like isoform X2 n=1 Tax=Crassostrea virginica TaxID=6565 RepID=A0A8B8B1K5_CRAVI|nr:DNA-binding protein P3A2-like isoform X2 [Crassostrea virginica]